MFTTFLSSSNAGILAVILVALAIIAVVLISNIKIVSQATAQVVERLGSYKTTWTTGRCQTYINGAGCGFSPAAGYYKG